jgi:L-alanine-DL-glutamate epimerase-like enolase superfamily enzyme
MKVTRIETLRCDAGWRIFSFLKVMTDDGLVGWSEYNESFGSAGLSQVIEALSPIVIGKDPRQIELINCHLRTQTVQSRGGINAKRWPPSKTRCWISRQSARCTVCNLFSGAVPIPIATCLAAIARATGAARRRASQLRRSGAWNG